MRVLVTRAEEESMRLAALLREHGHEPLLSPLTRVNIMDGPELALGGVQAVVVTSANGVRALERRVVRRDVPIFAVGPHTAAAARAAGFAETKEGGGDSHALTVAVREWAKPGLGTLLYVAGRDRTGDLMQRLSGSGFDIRLEVAYAAEAMALTGDAIANIEAGQVDAVMLFSRRGAQLLRAQVEQHQLRDACRRIAALCISGPASEPLMPLFSDIRIAECPRMDRMLALLAS